jgi:hypothetical protein
VPKEDRRRSLFQGPAKAVWVLLSLAVLALAFGRFFQGTYFSQDDFVWLCFCRFYPAPLAVFWRDTLAQQFFRPVGELWYLTLFSFAGNDVVPYQVGFLVVHLLNGYLAARLASAWIGPPLGRYVWLVFTFNGLFVDRISPHYFFIFDSLGFTFFLLSLGCLGRAQIRRPLLYGTLSLVAALASYWTKEAYYTLPSAAVLTLGLNPGTGWSWPVLRGRWRWLLGHGLLWALALGWRTIVLEGVGGYGTASISGPVALGRHLLERGGTAVGFAGWSLLPALARPAPEGVLAAVGSACLLAVLTGAGWWEKENRPWVVWSWCWMLITWAPSLLMTTYAPVSWYAPTFGAAVLAFLPFCRRNWAQPIGWLLGLYLSVHAWSHYGLQESAIMELRSQQAALEQRFPGGGSSESGPGYWALLDLAPDLYPDAVVKFQTPPGAPMADVFFLNPQVPVQWVLTNDQLPSDLWPLAISPVYQRGFLDLGRYRIYAISGAPNSLARPARPRPVRAMLWERGQFREIPFGMPPGNEGRGGDTSPKR